MTTALSDAIEAGAIVDPQEAGEQAGLRYVSDKTRGIGRRKAGKGWSYRLPNGKPVTDPKMLDRIRMLAIPPAYTDVWICPSVHGHIQVTGRDAKARKQYRYHETFRNVRDSRWVQWFVAIGQS